MTPNAYWTKPERSLLQVVAYPNVETRKVAIQLIMRAHNGNWDEARALVFFPTMGFWVVNPVTWMIGTRQTTSNLHWCLTAASVSSETSKIWGDDEARASTRSSALQLHEKLCCLVLNDTKGGYWGNVSELCTFLRAFGFIDYALFVPSVDDRDGFFLERVRDCILG